MKTGIFYSFNSVKTKAVATKIGKYFEVGRVEEVNVDSSTKDIFLNFDLLIFGVPTWFDGELPNYWDETLPLLEESDLREKKVAIFGLGNQTEYPENFCDAIGIVAEFVELLGAKIVGKTDLEGYQYEKSRAEKEGKFLGLALDQETQGRLSDDRIKQWVDNIKLEMK